MLSAVRVIHGVGYTAVAAALCPILWSAYDVRLCAIREFGAVIHEFDPYFNYRASEYLAGNGWAAFFSWFDHMSWYPLGRPVGTTIYPGPQIVAVGIWRGLGAIVAAAGQPSWSLVEVCCYIPAWFGVLATAFAGLLAAECAGSTAAGVSAAFVMAILPAHAMRSVGGGFDNESVAIAPMCAAFYFWCRSLRGPTSWPFAALAGLAYGATAASWGGYVFAVNMIGAHALLLTLLPGANRGWSAVYRAYTLFFIVGTALSAQVPPIGWSTPLLSAEHIVPVAAFLLLQAAAVHATLQRLFGPTTGNIVAVCGVSMGVAVAGVILQSSGLLVPASARVRALFGKHATRTGNPLVDSVAEHQVSCLYAPDLQQWSYLRHST